MQMLASEVVVIVSGESQHKLLLYFGSPQVSDAARAAAVFSRHVAKTGPRPKALVEQPFFRAPKFPALCTALFAASLWQPIFRNQGNALS